MYLETLCVTLHVPMGIITNQITISNRSRPDSRGRVHKCRCLHTGSLDVAAISHLSRLSGFLSLLQGEQIPRPNA